MGALAAILFDNDDAGSETCPAIARHFPRLSGLRQQLPGKLLQNTIPQNIADPSQAWSPSYARNNGEEVGDMHPGTSGRNLDGLQKGVVREQIAAALRAVPSAKHIARDTAEAGHPLSTESAENLRSGTNIPNGFNLILLARIYPELRAVVRQLIDSDFDADPKAYALFISAMQYAQGRVK